MNLRKPAFALFLDEGVMRQAGVVDSEVLAFVREVRAVGRPVVLCANTDDDLRAELAAAGIADDFDAVITSGEAGWFKPSKPFFEVATAAVETEAKRCLLVAATDRDVRGARAAGLVAIRFTTTADLGYARKALALPA
ncbi:FMN phosphatase YigB (HAD superfamily) [Allocatelliglobosispora scoriae]|uniref:FMN phosphatase YigB (HAD superfamily) n=1 Tax=Allocatelliglobosispora scoriae TaxID=643052 RepID=A0A841BXG0_9ACTN|nr:HAD family hydrolase [Allocatelliglobosispora scoriae]MBB5872206.1 FMN phosphatase YigB (HAD superfamily) [Allocatelliglobosispora scoriae]